MTQASTEEEEVEEEAEEEVKEEVEEKESSEDDVPLATKTKQTQVHTRAWSDIGH